MNETWRLQLSMGEINSGITTTAAGELTSFLIRRQVFVLLRLTILPKL
jgi:hypothetical protein